jgi:pentose-5-phosphate-3-epimerase
MDRDLDQVLVMTCGVEVDGGIDATTAPLVVRAGASVLVAGSAIFGDRDGVAAAMNRLRTALDDTRRETDCAERSALQRSQACSSE